MDIMKKLQAYREDMKRDLAELIAIPSERDLSTKKDNAPFGREIRQCFDKMITFAEREGFTVVDFGGYAMHIEYGEGKEVLAILGHLDTVGIQNQEEEWNSNPFELIETDGFWYGRGVNDNKGPMIGCFYLLKIIKELNYPINKKIRLILGGAEETTWECMDHYFKYNEMPAMGFSPDGDFPIINCEKGIGYYQYHGKEASVNDGIFNIVSINSNEDMTRVCSGVEVTLKTERPAELGSYLSLHKRVEMDGDNVTIIYEGISALGRNPHRGENALFKLIQDFKGIQGLDTRAQRLIDFIDRYFVDSIYGEKLGLYHEEQETGHTTNNLSYIILNDNGYIIAFDFRYPRGIDHDKILKRLNEIGAENEVTFEVIKEMPLLYVAPDSELILSLKAAYEKIVGESPQLLSKGAASYARALTQAVAFGPTFSTEIPNSHKANECINVDNLMKALRIYGEAIRLLT